MKKALLFAGIFLTLLLGTACEFNLPEPPRSEAAGLSAMRSALESVAVGAPSGLIEKFPEPEELTFVQGIGPNEAVQLLKPFVPQAITVSLRGANREAAAELDPDEEARLLYALVLQRFQDALKKGS